MKNGLNLEIKENLLNENLLKNLENEKLKKLENLLIETETGYFEVFIIEGEINGLV